MRLLSEANDTKELKADGGCNFKFCLFKAPQIGNHGFFNSDRVQQKDYAETSMQTQVEISNNP